MRLSRGALFGVVCAGLGLVTAAYLGYVALRTPPSPAAISTTTGPYDPALRAILDKAHLVFLQPSGGDPTQDVVAVAPLEQGTSVRLTTGPSACISPAGAGFASAATCLAPASFSMGASSPGEA